MPLQILILGLPLGVSIFGGIFWYSTENDVVVACEGSECVSWWSTRA